MTAKIDSKPHSSLLARLGVDWPTHSALVLDDSYLFKRTCMAKKAMERGLPTDRKAWPCEPSVAFTAQDIKPAPIANSTKWKQLWAQSQHAYRG